MSDYSLARNFFVWLGTFTAGDLADAMGIEDELAARFVRAGCWRIHGGEAILDDTGESVNGTYRGDERLYSYRPLPVSPRNHPHQLPEWIATPGCGALAPRNRGMPVRLVDERKRRQLLSSGGSAARVKRRDAAYQRMLDAWEERRQAQAAKRRREFEGG